LSTGSIGQCVALENFVWRTAESFTAFSDACTEARGTCRCKLKRFQAISDLRAYEGVRGERKKLT